MAVRLLFLLSFFKKKYAHDAHGSHFSRTTTTRKKERNNSSSNRQLRAAATVVVVVFVDVGSGPRKAGACAVGHGRMHAMRSIFQMSLWRRATQTHTQGIGDAVREGGHAGISTARGEDGDDV